MSKVLTIEDTRKMSKTKIEITLGEYCKELEKLGMDRVSARELLSSVMNLGISAHEQWRNKNQK